MADSAHQVDGADGAVGTLVLLGSSPVLHRQGRAGRRRVSWSVFDRFLNYSKGAPANEGETLAYSRHHPKATFSWYKPNLGGNHDFRAGVEYMPNRGYRGNYVPLSGQNYRLIFNNGVPDRDRGLELSDVPRSTRRLLRPLRPGRLDDRPPADARTSASATATTTPTFPSRAATPQLRRPMRSSRRPVTTVCSSTSRTCFRRVCGSPTT